MNRIEHALRLTGPGHLGRQALPEPTGILLQRIPRVVRQSVLMRMEGRTTPRGRPPRWLDRAADIRFVGLSGDDDTVLHFEAPTLGEAAEELYRQKTFWETRPDPGDTGFDLLGDVICDVQANNEESDRFDTRLLKRLTGFQKVLGGEYDQLGISGHRYAETAAVFDRQALHNAQEMVLETPSPSRVRIVGKLDMIRASTEAFAIKLEDGQEVRGVIAGGDIEDLAKLWQERVLVLGDAIYRPSGRLLRVDAEQVSLANGEPDLWSRMPTPNSLPVARRDCSKLQGPRSGLASIIGKWPGTESDEVIEAALRELS